MELPGPGAYTPPTDNRGNTFLGDAPAFSMGSRQTFCGRDTVSPGPVYSPRCLTPSSHGTLGDAPNFSFGSAKRFSSFATASPGPGSYAQCSTRMGGSMLGDAPKFGFGTSVQREDSPERRSGKRFISKVCCRPPPDG